ncbi:hypothetical protein ABPG74_006504 [Tetrahymena malaccensis]
MNPEQQKKKRKNQKSCLDVFNEAKEQDNQIKMVIKNTKRFPKTYNALCFIRNDTLLALGNNKGIEIAHFKSMKVIRQINFRVIASFNELHQNQGVNNNQNLQLVQNNMNNPQHEMINVFQDQIEEEVYFREEYVSIGLIKELQTNINWIGVSDYKRLKVWDYMTGLEKFHFENCGTISTFAESKKHKVLLIGNSKGQLQIGSLVDGKLTHLYPKSSVLQIIITPNQDKAVVCLSKNHSILIYDLEQVLYKNQKEGTEINKYGQIYSSIAIDNNKTAMIDSFFNLIIVNNDNFEQKILVKNLIKTASDDKRSIEILYLHDKTHIALYYKKNLLIYNYITKTIVTNEIANGSIKNFKTYAWNNISYSPKYNQIVIWAKSQQKGYLYTIDLINNKRTNQKIQNLSSKKINQKQTHVITDEDEMPFKVFLHDSVNQ